MNHIALVNYCETLEDACDDMPNVGEAETGITELEDGERGWIREILGRVTWEDLRLTSLPECCEALI